MFTKKYTEKWQKMENIALEEIVLTAMERKMLTEIIEEAMSTEVIETCAESTKETNLEIEKGSPKPLKPKSKEEVTEVTNNRHVEEIDTKEINEPRKEGFMMAIQNQHRRRSVRRILETFSVPRERICQKPLKEATEKEITAIILRRILDNLPAEESVRMRSRDEDRDVFELQISKHRRCIYAKNVRQLKNAKRLYLWRKKVTYNDLTLKEIEKSVRRAEEKDRRKQRRKAKCKEGISSAAKKCLTQTYDNSIFVDKLNQ